jgi:hypothetical protein
MTDNFIQPIKAGFGVMLRSFFDGLVPMTAGVDDLQSRGFANAVGICPGRMVDDAEAMLKKWLKDDTGTPSQGAMLPAMLVAFGHDYTPTGRDFARQLTDATFIRLEDDPRVFELRTMANDQRVQVAIAAHDPATAKSIAAQLALFLDSNRRFGATYPFAGYDNTWPVTIEMPDSPASEIKTGAKNLVLLVVDLNLKATIPLYRAPAEHEENDGSGLEPPGFPVVITVSGETTVTV